MDADASSWASAPKEIKIKICAILEEIRDMKVRRDEVVAVNPKEASRLRCEIFRKFGLVEFLSSRLEQMASSTWEMVPINKIVFEERKAAQAEKKDLEGMQIPQLGGGDGGDVEENEEKEKKKESFHLFMDLPAEIQTGIFGKLATLNDKLYAAEAVPSAVLPTAWNLTCFKLELLIPVLLNHNKLGFCALLKLLALGDSLRTVILTSYKSRFQDPSFPTHKRGWINIMVVPRSIREAGLELSSLNPLPGCIFLTFTVHNGLQHEQFRILRQIGRHVWDLAIKLSLPFHEGLPVIRDALQLVPNLKRLHLWCHGGGIEPWQADGVDLELPELSELECLTLKGHEFFDVGTLVLERYAQKLKCFRKFHTSPILARPPTPAPPMLTVLHLEGANIDMTVTRQDLEVFRGCPLKSLHVKTGGYPYNNGDDFNYLLVAAGYFAGTLEDLHLDLRSEPLKWSVYFPSDLAWLQVLEFPKVKTLSIRNNPETWSFLWQFPALETLTLTNDTRVHFLYPEPHWNAYFLVGNKLGLSWNREKMYGASIWKFLPFLKTVVFCRLGKNQRGMEKYSVTRAQCLAYQRKNARR